MTRKTARRQRGAGSLFQRASDGQWMGVVDLGVGGDGKRRRKTVSSKSYETASRKLRDLRRQVDDAGGDIPTAATTVTAWLDAWLDNIAAPRLRPKTISQYRSDVRVHITPALGRHRLDKLAPQHVRAMHTAITGKGNSPTTALRCHAVLSKALTDAMREGLIARNVASLVDRPRKAASTRGALTADQGRTLLRSVAADALGARWAAALLTGARQGELLGLQRHRVTTHLDLSWQLQRLPYTHGCQPGCGKARAGSCPDARLEVPAGFEYQQLSGSLCLTRPKSKAGHRIVPLVEPLRSILARHIAATDPGPHGLVWSNDGKPIHASADLKAWHAALERAGLPSVPLHAARHTTATLLLEAGVDAHVIMAILGHSSVLTSRGYLHVSQGLSIAALERLSLALD